MNEEEKPLPVYVRLATHKESEKAKSLIIGANRWADHWGDNSVYLLCRSDTDAAIGFVRYWKELYAPFGQVALNLTVDERYRGQKLGQFLLSSMMDQVQRNNVEFETWYLDIENPDTSKLDWRIEYYQAMGYRVVQQNALPREYLDLIAPAEDNLRQTFMRCLHPALEDFSKQLLQVNSVTELLKRMRGAIFDQPSPP